jgi:hypothetical protein
MNVKEDFLSMDNFNLHDGRQIRFWEDSWLGTMPLKLHYPNLYNIVRRKNAMVADIFSLRPLNVPLNTTVGHCKGWHLLYNVTQIHRYIDFSLGNRKILGNILYFSESNF